MSKKKIGSIVVLLVLLVTLAIVSNSLLSGRGKSTKDLDGFLVMDTLSVDRIELTQSSGMRIEIKRQGSDWRTVEGTCVQKEMVDNVLHTFTKVAIKSYVPKSGIENITNQIRMNYRKAKIYQNGKWVKTWWIGNGTPDKLGTYALLETPEGVAEVPVILEMRGLHGSLDSRFTADLRTWLCTEIFSFAIDEIQSVSFTNHEDKEQSFTIERLGKGRNFAIQDFRKNRMSYDTLKLVRYLDIFKKVHFEGPNYTLNNEQIDSLKKEQPSFALKLTSIDGISVSLDAYRIAATSNDLDLAGNPLEYDMNRMWAFINKNQLVKIQYFVFDPIFVDISFFKAKSLNEPLFN
jgi:hypothetical protein